MTGRKWSGKVRNIYIIIVILGGCKIIEKNNV